MTRASRNRTRTVVIAAILASLLSCSAEPNVPEPPPAAATEQTSPSSAAAAPALSELAEATYSGLFDEPVTLHEGRWEGEPFVVGGASRPTAQLVDDFLVTGDLDGDGNEESVALVSTSSGGSGTSIFLALAGRSDGAVGIRGTALVGDRVQVRSARLSDGGIALDVVQAGPEDAACCPSQKATRLFALGPQGLAETGATLTGTLSVADLGDVEWVLQRFSWEEPAPSQPEVTLSFEGSRASGYDGCNRYFGEVEETAPGEIRFGPVGATRRACEEDAMALEQRYLAALGGVTKYAFLAGRLALTYSREGALSTLLFVSREAGGAGQKPGQP